MLAITGCGDEPAPSGGEAGSGGSGGGAGTRGSGGGDAANNCNNDSCSAQFSAYILCIVGIAF